MMIMSEMPVRLCCGERHLTVACPDGLVMCCLCFHRFPQEKLWADATGQRWDICRECGEAEERRGRS
jgi:hypothetical protein